jgi:hypothetical protein
MSRTISWDAWTRRACALVVAGVAAYASYEHQRAFALRGGADATSASLWPLSVDGLLLLATVALLRGGPTTSRRVRRVIWATVVLGVAVSLAANVAAAPRLGWQPVLVAGWPPVALLLAVELLTHRPTNPGDVGATQPEPDSADEAIDEVITRAEHQQAVDPQFPTAEQVMWSHYQRERAAGRTPTGAELDRVAGTNNYGRRVLRRWAERGQIDPAAAIDPRRLASPPSR